MNDRSAERDYSLQDGAVDVSLLGLSVPLGLYTADDPRMKATAEVVEQVLAVEPAGGLMRYEYDSYIGGNPWIIAAQRGHMPCLSLSLMDLSGLGSCK